MTTNIKELRTAELGSVSGGENDANGRCITGTVTYISNPWYVVNLDNGKKITAQRDICITFDAKRRGPAVKRKITVGSRVRLVYESDDKAWIDE